MALVSVLCCRLVLPGFVALLIAAMPAVALAQAPQSWFATINGFRMHYLVVGNGTPVVLLPGYAWRKE